MRKFAVLTILIMFLLLSCRKEKSDMDLLYGSWIEEANTGHPRQTIDFTVGGDYCLIDYINMLPGGLTVYKCTITGEFEIDGHYVTLVTAEVQNMEQGTGSGDFQYEGPLVVEGVPFGSYFGTQGSLLSRTGMDIITVGNSEYTPITWEVLSLTDELLEVKADLETLRYVRQ